MKNFTSAEDVKDLEKLIQEGIELKNNPRSFEHLGKGQTIGLIFFNASLRTRLSTQKAAQNLGMDVIVMNFNQEGWQLELEDGVVMNQGSQEHIKEAVPVLCQYCDIIGVRSFAKLINKAEDYSEPILSAFLKYASVPVISLESTTLHPLQSLADLITIKENCSKKNPKIVLSWAPHPKALPQAVANSFAQWILKAGYDLTITHPEGFELDSLFTKGSSIEHDQQKAFEEADFVYTKNWSSLKDYGKIGDKYHNWIIDDQKMLLTNNAYFMHCLPIRRNVVATDQIIDHSNSLLIHQANNRTYAAQAVLKQILENE